MTMQSLDQKIEEAINSMFSGKGGKLFLEDTTRTPPLPSEQQWYIASGGKREGPMSFEDLESRYTSGSLSRGTLVWKKGMSDWSPIEKIDRFSRPKTRGREKILSPSDMFSVRGAVGSGRYSDAIAKGRSRATADPSGLIRDLKITAPTGASDLDKCYAILSQAINGNKVLKRAFKSPLKFQKNIQVKKQTSRGPMYVSLKIPAISVPLTNLIEYRNAMFYIQSILIGAYNAGILTVSAPMKFSNEEGASREPTIYSTSKKQGGFSSDDSTDDVDTELD